LTQINKELEQLKLIGLKEDDALEMMRQIGSYKSSFKESFSIVKEEADLRILMHGYTGRVVKKSLLAVVLVVLFCTAVNKLCYLTYL
jgi:hypothetical protein